MFEEFLHRPDEGMQELTEQLAREFDFVILDCPAGIEDGFKNAIAGAQKTPSAARLQKSANGQPPR